jgi:GNAT superfamily N-acetyltransferase
MAHIQLATTDEEIARCFEVLSQLRPHLKREDFLPRIRKMEKEGFRLAYLEEAGGVCAVAGYRYMDMLVTGPVLYVDDLVTSASERSRGHGAALMRWLKEQAREHGCQALELDSGVQRGEAHRFYFRERLTIVGYHFSLPLEPPGA